ncbi:unnamed protein product [Linum tenue]|uniref:Uncharacterized protein n=1 Tax=Linum tenue TaxID=586396 RepID=A0AAV0LKY0_9ROSI|nr:unnamed protein product [Linum tenue]
MAGPNMDQFDAYFRRADLDGDGKISGAEAVAFFQGSNLHKQVLAQIWMHADQSRSGFLGRAEFYNALKLVTVAQSKRELTPEIVKAALYGPAAAKIPAPQINLAAVPAPQASSMAAPQIGMPASVSAQSPGIRPQGVPTVGMNPNYFPSQQNQFMRPAQPIPPVSGPRPPQAIAPVAAPRPPQMISPAAAPHLPQASMMGSSQAMPTGTAYRPATQSIAGGAGGLATSTSGSTTDWLGGRSGGSIPGAGPRGASLTSGLQQLTPSPMSSQSIVSDSKAIVSSGNASASTSSFGDDMFSVTPSTQKQEPPKPTYSAANASPTSALAPVSSMGQGPIKSNSLGSLQDAFFQQSLGGLQRAQSLPTIGQQVSASSSSLPASPATSVGLGSALDNNSQPGWPKMKAAEIQKYTKVFMEVDTDRDGKITGEQARTLFLSWRLPREVLKLVWDLSDQDSDSMLSLREFCFALYLMERFREGRPLPPILPRNVMFDETLMSMTGQPKAAYGNAAWAPGAGFAQQPGMGPRPPMGPAPGLRPPAPVPGPPHDVAAVSSQNNSGSPVLDDSFLSRENGDSGNAMLQNGTAEKKALSHIMFLHYWDAEGAEKLILDSREKIEYFRGKMQDLVLYKSRCDNRLNEITERALADKREAEILGKKYEEKYKQVAEVASKLTIEEAQFRDIQERKKELHQAIVNMEQGGSADGLLQVRADRIQSDLDELMKVLIERSKKHSLDIKSTAMVELPFGWQPGIQENAAPWDEEWDKFEDAGFGHDLTIDVKNVSETANGKANAVQNGIASPDGSLTPDSLSNGDAKSGNFRNIHDHEHNLEENESAYAHSEVESVARSPQGSPAGRTPSRDFSDVFAKSTEGDSEAHRSFDDSAWGAAFDSNDDVDSVWGFNPASAKDTDSEKHQDFFGGEDFGIKPIRTSGSPTSTTTDHIFQKKSIFFEESVAGSPMSRFANSPRFSEAGDQFDSFSRFDSFSMQEGSGFSPQKATLSRFDSINSSKDFGGGGGGYDRSFSSFDDADPFGSSEPFKVSTSSDHHHSPKKSSDNWNAF